MKNLVLHRMTGVLALAAILACGISLALMRNAYGGGTPPTISDIADQTTNEDTPTALINFTVGDVDDSVDSLDVTATSSNQALVPDAGISLGGIGANRTISLAPAADENGSTTITVTVTDGASPVSDTFVLTIAAVNDAPYFIMGPDVTAPEDTSYAAGWATDIIAGPPNESEQLMRFRVINDNNALFSVNPYLTPSGSLFFIPAPNANGSALVTVIYLQDSGGTANGGVNTYIPVPNTFTITVTPVNDEPSFVSGGNVSVDEDSGNFNSNWATGMTPGPADELGQLLTFDVSNDQNAYFTNQPGIDDTGRLTFRVAADAHGTANVTVYLRDDGSNISPNDNEFGPLAFTITILPVNDEPFFAPGADVSVAEDSGSYSAAWATSISPGPNEAGQTLAFSVSSNNPGLFSLQPALSSDGTLSFTPALNANGSAILTVYLHDDGGTANGGVDTYGPATFTITITPVNDEPSFISGGNIFVIEDSGNFNSNWATGITSGPPDELGQLLTFDVSNDQNTFFSNQPDINSEGRLTFRVATNAHGTANVTVYLRDNGSNISPNDNEFGPLAFTITILPVNDEPFFAPGADVSVAEDSGSYSAAWATSISPGPNEAAQALAFSVSSNNPGLFSVQPAISSAGTLSFTPALNANGSAILTVYLHDDGGTANGGIDTCGPATFTITITPVNDEPSFTNGGTVTVLEDSGSYSGTWATGISAGPADENGQTLTFFVSNDNTALFSVQPVIAGDGTLAFTTALNANGSATVSVILQDDGGIANGGDDTYSDTFTITITPVNDAPTANDDTGTANEDTVLYMAYPGVLGNDTDPDIGDVLTVSAHDPISTRNAIVVVNPNGSYSYDPNGQFEYLGLGLSTTDTFNYTASDGNGGASSATVTITINGMNDVPTIGGDATGAVTEDTGNPLLEYGALTISDPDAGQSSFIAQTMTTPFSTFTIYANGNWTYAADNAHPAIQSIAAGATRIDSFTVTSFDGSATQSVAITITGVNDFPTVSGPLTVVKTEDDPAFILNLLQGAADTDATDALNVINLVNVQGNSAGITVVNNTLEVNPSAYNNLAVGHAETIRYTYDIIDGHGGIVSQTATITITGLNDNPIVSGIVSVTRTDDDPIVIVNLLAGASDPDNGDILHVANLALQSGDASGVTTNGDFLTVEPSVYNDLSIGESVVIVFWYDIVDGHGGLVRQTARITINGANDLPTITDIFNQTILEDSATGLIPFTIMDFEAGPLTVTATSSNAILVPNTGIALGVISDNLRTIKVIPAKDKNGSTTITVTVQDKDGGTASDSFMVNVTPVNDEPVFTDGGDITVLEDSGAYTQVGWARNISPGPPDEALQLLSWNITISNPVLFSVRPSLDLNGTLTFTPAPSRSGSATVRASLTDSGGTANGGVNTSSIHIFTITITPTNDPPVAVDDNFSTVVNEPKSDNVLNNDWDIDNAMAELFASVVASPQHGSVTMSPNGSFTYTPDLNYAGMDAFTYVVSDGEAQSNIATVFIAIIPNGGKFLRPWDGGEDYRWVKVRSGVAVDLACTGNEKGVIITLKATGDGIVLSCMPDSVARLFQVTEEDLPDALPARFKYASGFTAEIVKENKLLTVLPGWMRISFVIPNEVGNYTILYWDKQAEAWFELPSAIDVTGNNDVFEYGSGRKVLIGVRAYTDYNRIEAVINFTGTYILVKK